MDTCGIARFVVPSVLLGVAVSSVTGSDLLGVLGAGLTAAALFAAQRTGGAETSCAIGSADHPHGAEDPAAATDGAR